MTDNGLVQSELVTRPPHWPTHGLRLVDVGGAGGVQPKWRAHAGQIFPILFEPNPVEAAKLRDSLKDTYNHALVLETGLSNVIGPQDLNITRYWGCTSLRQPNPYRSIEISYRAPIRCHCHYESRVHAL